MLLQFGLKIAWPHRISGKFLIQICADQQHIILCCPKHKQHRANLFRAIDANGIHQPILLTHLTQGRQDQQGRGDKATFTIY